MQKLLLITAAAILLSACAKGEDTEVTKKMEIDLKTGASTLTELDTIPTKACLNVRFNNNYYYFYSENYAEGWVASGSCTENGPRFDADFIGVSWRYKGEGPGSRKCEKTSMCAFSERNYGNGKNIECASASIRHGGIVGSTTTDFIACP